MPAPSETRPGMLVGYEADVVGAKLIGKLVSARLKDWRILPPTNRDNYHYEPFRIGISLGRMPFDVVFSRVTIERETTYDEGLGYATPMFSEPTHVMYKIDVVDNDGVSANVLRIGKKSPNYEVATQLDTALHEITPRPNPYASEELEYDFFKALRREFE
jgi:hypothetical protein